MMLWRVLSYHIVSCLESVIDSIIHTHKTKTKTKKKKKKKKEEKTPLHKKKKKKKEKAFHNHTQIGKVGVWPFSLSL